MDTGVGGLNAQKNDLTWTARWTPRSIAAWRTHHRFEAKQSLTIAPGVSAFFKERVTFQAESLTFEVLGLGTFTYLKSIFMSYGNDLGRWQESPARRGILTYFSKWRPVLSPLVKLSKMLWKAP